MGLSLAAAVMKVVGAVAPIDGVSIGDPANKATWTVSFQESATAPQIAAAQAVIDAFDLVNGETNYLRTLPALEDDSPPRIFRARCRLQAASFACANNTARSVPWTAEIADPLAMHDPVSNSDRIVLPHPGWYQFIAGLRWTESGSRTGQRTLQVARGPGSPEDLGTDTRAPAPAGSTSNLLVDFVKCEAAGEFLRCFVLQDSGGSLNAVGRITVGRVE